jgi:hypothetical protein
VALDKRLQPQTDNFVIIHQDYALACHTVIVLAGLESG